MAKIFAPKTPTSDLWRLLTRGGDGVHNEAQSSERASAAISKVSDSDGLADGQSQPQFQPRYVRTPDGTEWS